MDERTTNRRMEKIKLTQGLAVFASGLFMIVFTFLPFFSDNLAYYGTHEFYTFLLEASAIVVAYSVILLVYGMVKRKKACAMCASVGHFAIKRSIVGVVFLIPLAIALYHLVAEETIFMAKKMIDSYIGKVRIASIVLMAVGIVAMLMSAEEMSNGKAKLEEA